MGIELVHFGAATFPTWFRCRRSLLSNFDLSRGFRLVEPIRAESSSQTGRVQAISEVVFSMGGGRMGQPGSEENTPISGEVSSRDW